ncbi:hypothetical protein [Paenibacillus anseongense]|uniref:hypothetical protein n=1 Tax=Paenibacillus anseongense TaxID=2682845 RepID=UPI002DBE2EF3|nr:hypothetical protein [Paenibacillus anseongense]MEC0269714.1 hypothetical protein [Paenibacillus anseongense]
MYNKDSIFWTSLLDWFSHGSRSYPWRKTYNPYHVLLAEFLLQQTHVRKVESVYHNILNTYPTLGHIAVAEINSLVKFFEPIGLLYRSTRLRDTAEIIVSDYGANVPDTYKELISLPGIGDYIANAVLCYAYDQNTVPVDTNVIRLFSRYFGFASDKARPRTDKKLALNIASVFPESIEYRKANLAILDYAGLVCTARNPVCVSCCFSNYCTYKKTLTE